tara:strand:+ start:554 stop:979 length:426 start_codon:yes stop_codon:yes gene_type:complete
MNLKKAEKALDTLDENAKKISKISDSVSDFKKTAAELKKLPSELEKDSSLITLKIHEFKDKVLSEFDKYKKDNDVKIENLKKDLQSNIENLKKDNKLNIETSRESFKIEIDSLRGRLFLYFCIFVLLIIGLFIMAFKDLIF